MAFHDVRFPEIIEAGMEGGPSYLTTVVESTGGAEKRNAAWSLPRYKWRIGTGIRDQAGLDVLIAFFHARQGRLHSFRFKDWVDFQSNGDNIGTGDGATTTFQLRRVHTSGGVSLYRKITRPVSGTVKIYKAGVEQVSGVSVSTSTGLVTFSVAPSAAQAITWTGEFDVPVRFDADELPITLEAVDVGELSQMEIVEVRE